MMDEVFIEHPNLHKYFYPEPLEVDYCKELPKDKDELELAICIAEKFRDVFQYSEHMAVQIYNKTYKKDCESYLKYMERIQDTAVYKEMSGRNPIDIEIDCPIGQTLRETIANKNSK